MTWKNRLKCSIFESAIVSVNYDKENPLVPREELVTIACLIGRHQADPGAIRTRSGSGQLSLL